MGNQTGRLRKRLARLGALLGAVSVVWACNAPSFPVPPPNPTFSQGATATSWVAQGPAFTPAGNGRYYFYDETSGTGVIKAAAADGSYDGATLDGNVDDHILIYFETQSGELGESICRLLEPGLADASRSCPP
jgi:hypothetical protein